MPVEKNKKGKKVNFPYTKKGKEAAKKMRSAVKKKVKY